MPRPTLLIEGIEGIVDLAMDPVSVETYRNTVPTCQVVTFTHSGHFPHFEEPKQYADLVRNFVNQHVTPHGQTRHQQETTKDSR
ncbi:hypothetical protein EV651_107360 [Kribbella sp. VKM Ac-2571]|uniref:alpha/beta fold hydrolase n=1 Tax=Kribbella sp. VKM Ac-2571 TaxID=2512222 RepID=UPI00105F5188|nr:alpha/beta hydrolase [Kribbella sp. VKM Ac-2571]TDO61085.1 hypothetical protein EV651_107360 [Kribbella sp. VKM Ac-2571]